MTKNITPKNIILYAEDDEDDRFLIEEAFAVYAERVEMICVNDGSEAISYLDSLAPFDPTPCLIILDINMPLLNGKETLKKIRRDDRFKDTPAILFTTSSSQSDKDFAKQNNAGFITKPIDAMQMHLIADVFIQYCTEDIRKDITGKSNIN